MCQRKCRNKSPNKCRNEQISDITGKGNGKCKGPVLCACVECFSISKETTVAEGEKVGEKDRKIVEFQNV